MDASLHPHPRSPARCGEGSAAQGGPGQALKARQQGVNCAYVSRKSTASLALRGLEDSRIVSSGLPNPEPSIPCLPRSKAIATLSTCSTAQPWGQVFLPAILRCLKFIPGDNHYCSLSLFPKEPTQEVTRSLPRPSVSTLQWENFINIGRIPVELLLRDIQVRWTELTRHVTLVNNVYKKIISILE